MFKKFISLSLAFILFFSCFAQSAGNDLPLGEIKRLLSTPDKYSKDSTTLVAMSVLAGLPFYGELFNSVSYLKEQIALKEAALKDMQEARLIKDGWNVMYPVAGTKGMDANFPALQDYYNRYKKDVYEPAEAKIKEYRMATLSYPNSQEVRAKWEAEEKVFEATEKRFNALERQYLSARNTLLKKNVPQTEKNLMKEIANLKVALRKEQGAFNQAQYQLFRDEYNALMAQLRQKAGLFLPAETERVGMYVERDLRNFEHAATEADFNAARKNLAQSIEKLTKRNAAVKGKEMLFYKEAVNKFFTNLSKRLNLRSSVPLLAAGGIMVFMLSAQGAQAAGISNRNVAISRQLEYAYVKTPDLMLANTVSLSKCYGADAVAAVIYENQEYIPVLQKQITTLKYISDVVTKEQDVANDIVISSKAYQLPQYKGPLGF